MSKTEIEVKKETAAERAARFETRTVRIYEKRGELGLTTLVDTLEMSFTKALKMKYERSGVVIEGLHAWVDEHKGRLRIKPRVIERLQHTEQFADNITAWAKYDDYVLLVAARDLPICDGLTIYEDEEFFYPRLLCRWVPTTKEEGIKFPYGWGTGFAAYTADGQRVEFPVRSKKVSAYPWEGPR